MGVHSSKFVLRSYSPYGFLSDLAVILHMNSYPPWEDPKYGKRIVRYAALAFTCLLSSKEEGAASEKLSELERFATYISKPKESFERKFSSKITLLTFLADIEEKTFQTTSDSKLRREYYKTLHSHFSNFISLFHLIMKSRYSQDAPNFNILPITELDYLNRYLHL